MKSWIRLGVTLVLFGLTACSHTRAGEPHDPLEAVNRPIYSFNRVVDKVIFRPVAMVYYAVTPKVVRSSVGNFFVNLSMPKVIVNDLLQGEMCYAVADSWRFALNSTLGIGGLFDVASRLGLNERKQDFGLTLARWGYEDSSYLVLPFLPPSTIRDSFGRVLAVPTSPYLYVDNYPVELSLAGLNFIHERSKALGLDSILDKRDDPYAMHRSIYMQMRSGVIAETEPVGVCGGRAR